jgi:hypothetical protein
MNITQIENIRIAVALQTLLALKSDSRKVGPPILSMNMPGAHFTAFQSMRRITRNAPCQLFRP